MRHARLAQALLKVNAHLAAITLLSMQLLQSALVMSISLEIRRMLMNAHPVMRLATAAVVLRLTLARLATMELLSSDRSAFANQTISTMQPLRSA